MAVSGRMSAGKAPAYLLAQTAGALLAGLALYGLFEPSIAAYESAHGIVRGGAQSMLTARMFGEYYQLPGGTAAVSMPLALAVEGFGTFMLVLIIFSLTEGCNLGRPDHNLMPLFVGLTVTVLICLLAPLSQAAFNPARDFGPWLVAWAAGWGEAAFPDRSGGFFWVYILAPILTDEGTTR